MTGLHRDESPEATLKKNNLEYTGNNVDKEE